MKAVFEEQASQTFSQKDWNLDQNLKLIFTLTLKKLYLASHSLPTDVNLRKNSCLSPKFLLISWRAEFLYLNRSNNRKSQKPKLQTKSRNFKKSDVFKHKKNKNNGLSNLIGSNKNICSKINKECS